MQQSFVSSLNLSKNIKCYFQYYDGLQLTPKSRQQRINQVSRHRAFIPMPMTPKHYWEVGMPDRNECIRRGK